MAEDPNISKPPQISPLKIVLLTVLVILLSAGSAGGAWYFMSNKSNAKHETNTEEPSDSTASEEENESSHEEAGKKPLFVSLDPFTVNLLPEGQFLQATFVLEVKDDATSERIQTYMPQIRSRILLCLSGKTAEALSSQQGKSDLIKEIKQLISQAFKPGQKPTTVDEVHVTAFIIQ